MTQIIGWVILITILGGGAWFFCSGVGNKSRNKGSLHGGGIERSSESAYHGD